MVSDFSASLWSMVIFDSGFSDGSFLPAEKDSPLVVDSDTPVSPQIAPHCLQSVCWRNPEIPKFSRLIQHAQFSTRTMLADLRQSGGADSLVYLFRLAITE